MGFERSVIGRVVVAAGVMASASLLKTQSTPQLFAPNVVSTVAPEFGGAFTPDGSEMYFNRASADRSTLTIMMTRRSATGQWSAPVVAPFSGTFRDVDPFVTPDGRRVFFSSDRPRQTVGTDLRSVPTRPFATWLAERHGSQWSEPIDPGAPLNSSAGDVFFTMTRDGSAVFTSSRGGPSRIYSAREREGHWDTPSPLAFGATTDGSNPAIAPSGRFIVFVRTPEGGAADLVFSCRTQDRWSEPRPLTAINSTFADFAPNIDASEKTLTFTSERPGIAGPQPTGMRPPGDLYRVSLEAAGIRCR